MRLLTQKAYARLRKVTPQYVNKLVRQGRIKLRAGKIDPRTADTALAQFRPERSKIRLGKTRKPRKGKGKARKPRAAAPRSRNAHGGGRPAPGDPRSNATQSLTRNRSEREGWAAKLAKIEYEKAAGNLLPKAEVLEAEQKKNANIRNRFRRIPRALAPLLAATRREPAEIEALLLEAVEEILLELAADPLGQNPARPAGDTPVMPAVDGGSPGIPSPSPDNLQASAQPAAEVRP